MTSTVTSRRKRLGIELRRARKLAKMTQQHVAETLGCTQGKINKIESGAVGVKQTDVQRLSAIYGLTAEQTRMLLEFARESVGRRPRWTGYRSAVPHWFRIFTDLEPIADEVWTWHNEKLPSLLQSERFLFSQFGQADMSDISSMVQNCNDRKAILDGVDPPRYRFIIGESALRRMANSTTHSAMLNQLEYMSVLGQKENVNIHILPFDAPATIIPNDFSIMRFSCGTKDFAYFEHVAGGEYVEDPREFELFAAAWHKLLKAAMDSGDSEQFLKGFAESYRASVNA